MADSGEQGEPVTVAYVAQNEVTHSWHRSMMDLVGWDLANRGSVLAGGFISMRCGTDGLVEARNKAVQTFLEDKPADWLWWVDTDMGFAPDTVDRLLEVADPVERPIVGGLCFAAVETGSDGMGGWRIKPTPTIYDWTRVDADGGEQMGYSVRREVPENAVVRCAGTGSACILIHRSVFERILDGHGPVWYKRVPNATTGQLISEDLSFCLRAGALNIPVHVHTGVKTTHMKTWWVSDVDYHASRALGALGQLADESRVPAGVKVASDV